MPTPKTLKIFLLDGEPTGSKIVEISNWTGKAYVIPRNKLKDLLNRGELNSQSIYFLFGETELGKQKIYVGEAEEFKKRILQHNQNKDFWNLAICFISKDDNLTKAHIKYLEAVIIEKIKKAGRVEIENGNNGSTPKLPESDKADMDLFLENLQIVMSSLGYVFMEDLSVEDNINKDDVYFVSGRNIKGVIRITNEGYVVQKGSTIAGEDVNSFTGTPLSVWRFQVFNSHRVAKLEDGNYELLENMVFTSPSYAAAFILGRSSNGWTTLKNSSGKTLDEIKRKEL